MIMILNSINQKKNIDNKSNNYELQNEVTNDKENLNIENVNNKREKAHITLKSGKNSIENSIKHTFPSDINKNKYTGIKQRNTPIEERAKYVINLEKIINERDLSQHIGLQEVNKNSINKNFIIKSD